MTASFKISATVVHLQRMKDFLRYIAEDAIEATGVKDLELKVRVNINQYDCSIGTLEGKYLTISFVWHTDTWTITTEYGPLYPHKALKAVDEVYSRAITSEVESYGILVPARQ